MVTEFLARWRRSTTLALTSIDTLEKELARKTDAVADLSVRLADREAVVASGAQEREALRAYAQRLEGHLGRMLDAAAAVQQQEQGEGPASSLPEPLAAALRDLQQAAAGVHTTEVGGAGAAGQRGGSPGGPGGAPSASAAPAGMASPSVGATAVADVEGLTNAVREGGDTVLQFFAELDASYPPPPASADRVLGRGGGTPIADSVTAGATATPSQPPLLPPQPSPSVSGAAAAAAAAATSSPAALPSEHEQALRNIDATLRRALAFAGTPSASTSPSGGAKGAPVLPGSHTAARASATSRRVATAAAAAAAAASASSPTATSPPPGAGRSTSASPRIGPRVPNPAPQRERTRVAALDVEFDPLMHARATVAQLKTAVALKAGKQPLSLAIAGRPLTDDSARLVDVGVPVRATIEVVFAEPAPAAAGPAPARAVQPPPAPPLLATTGAGAHVPRPAAPLVFPATKLSPPIHKRPLMSPAPHRAPRGLGTVPVSASAETTSTTTATEVGDGGEEATQQLQPPGPITSAASLPASRGGLSSATSPGFSSAGSAADDEDRRMSFAIQGGPSKSTAAADAPAPASPSSAAAPAPSPSAGSPPVPPPASSSRAAGSELPSSHSPRLVREESARILSLAQGLQEGQVTGSVFHAALSHPSQERQREAILRSIFRTIDTDGSNTLTLVELEAYVAAVRSKTEAAAAVDAAGTSAGPAAAAAGSSPAAADVTLAAEDGVPLAFHAAFCAVLSETTGGTLAAAFSRYDTNSDGVLDMDEFLRAGNESFVGAEGGGGEGRVESATRAAAERDARLVSLEAQRKALRAAEEEAAAASAKAALQAEALRQLELEAHAASLGGLVAGGEEAGSGPSSSSSSAAAEAASSSSKPALDLGALKELSQKRAASPRGSGAVSPPTSVRPRVRGGEGAGVVGGSATAAAAAEEEGAAGAAAQTLSVGVAAMPNSPRQPPQPRKLSPLVKPHTARSGGSGPPPPPPPPGQAAVGGAAVEGSAARPPPPPPPRV
jgi:Ca2+-binding EF-hand superfamily protein